MPNNQRVIRRKGPPSENMSLSRKPTPPAVHSDDDHDEDWVPNGEKPKKCGEKPKKCEGIGIFFSYCANSIIA